MSETDRIRRVVIAGGGTAGWIAACALSHQFRTELEVTLVESEQIGTVGVGESTIPPIRSFHQFLQIDEREFLRAVAGTFKLSISFENWRGDGEHYIHPFGIVGQGTQVCAFHHFWLESLRRGMHSDFDEFCLETQASRQGRFALQQRPPLNYAYHLDAGLYARFLRGISERYGVRRIEGRIAHVSQHQHDGAIQALILEDGQRIEGDLFIDCTGFRGLLIEQTLQTGYEDWSHWLPCDRAVAVQTESTQAPLPYTRAIAHQAGWRWQIPLQHRVGNGLVYASRFMSDDQAQAQLLQAVGGRPINDPRLVPFCTGRRRKVWNKNVAALGLASGFIEPLESTSIQLTIAAVMRLLMLFPFEGIASSQIEIYNEVSRAEMEHVRDFIILHYHANQRSEAMWQHCQEMALPSSLELRLRAWKECAHVWQSSNELFRADSWVHVLLGQGNMPQQHHPLPRALSDANLRGLIDSIRAPIQQAVAGLPMQQAFIDRYCKSTPQIWGG